MNHVVFLARLGHHLSPGETVLMQLLFVVLIISAVVVLWHLYLQKRLGRVQSVGDSVAWPFQKLFRRPDLEIWKQFSPSHNRQYFHRLAALFRNPRMLMIAVAFSLANSIVNIGIVIINLRAWQEVTNPRARTFSNVVVGTLRSPFAYLLRGLVDGTSIVTLLAALICLVVAVFKPSHFQPVGETADGSGLASRLRAYSLFSVLLFVAGILVFSVPRVIHGRVMMFIFTKLFPLFSSFALMAVVAASYGLLLWFVLLANDQSLEFGQRLRAGFRRGTLVLLIPYLVLYIPKILQVTVFSRRSVNAATGTVTISYGSNALLSGLLVLATALLLVSATATDNLQWRSAVRLGWEAFRQRGLHLLAVLVHATAAMVLMRLILAPVSYALWRTGGWLWGEFAVGQIILLVSIPISLAMLVEFRHCVLEIARDRE